MEHLHPTSFPESLKATLNCYQITSIDSLSGPSGYPALAAQMWYKENKQLPPIPPQPMVQIPYFIPNDKSAKRSETMLAGEKIACFIVGGERRLCLPQILTSVLREYSIAEINQACAELHIYCSRCLPEQLEILKALGILPINTAQCGLITKTDAERLVALLMDQHDPVKKERLPKDIEPESGFSVYHECFGRGYGKFYPKAYVSPTAQCVICEDCGCLYSPQRFITHSDRSFEKRTCHWGFDPDNWRSYLLIPKNIEEPKREELQKILDQMKARFDKPRYELTGPPPPVRYTTSPPTPSKRRFDSELESPSRKKIKEEDGKMFEPSFLPPYAALPYGVPGVMRHSAFRPWSPGLSTMAGPNHSDLPVIQDLTHLKGLVPFTLDRRGFPQYIQTSRPLVPALIGSRASEFSIPPHTDTRVSSSIAQSLHTSNRRKSSEPEKLESAKIRHKSPARDGGATEKDKNNNHRDHGSAPSIGQPMLKVDLTRSRSFERSLAERQQNRSISPLSRSIAAISPRARGPISPTRYPSTLQLPRSTLPQSSNNNNALKEPQEHEITRPISRSREAAATAMLELKSAGLYRSAPPPLLVRPGTPPASSASSETSRKLPTTPNTPKSTPSVVPLDSSRQHYKWTIGGHSYIISASGVQNLEMLQNILRSDCGNEAGKTRLIHELVKTKSLSEEKLDIEMRVRRDIENELEHLKASKRGNGTSEARKLIKQDIENFRQEHIKRCDGLNRRENFLRKMEDETGRGREEKSPAEREFKEMRSRIHELEIANDKLRLNLIEERGKREDAELRLEEVEHTRGRIPFLLDSPLSRMVRGNAGRRTTAEDERTSTSPRTAPSPSHKKISSTQVPIFTTSSAATNSMSHCQLNGFLPTTSSSIIRLSREQLRQSDIETPKTVVVS